MARRVYGGAGRGEGMKSVSRWCSIALVSLVRGYQYWFSSWLGGRCRYVPSCSHYAIEAIERFGPLKGTCLMVGRLVRCQPWGDGGYDPVPEREAQE